MTTTYTAAENREIAGNIMTQLGGYNFLAMAGKIKFYTDGGIVLELTRNKVSAKWLTITLEAGKDTYNLHFQKTTKGNIVTVKQLSSIYADQLRRIFTEVTGLYTYL